MAGNQIKDILVLSAGDIASWEFVAYFGTYLQYDSYEEAQKWESKTFETEDINGLECSEMLIGSNKFNFIHSPMLDDDVFDQIRSVLFYFISKQKLNAIIFIVQPSELENEKIAKYKYSIFSELRQFADKNVLYVVSTNNDSYKHENNVLNSFIRKERNEFYFQEKTFLNISKDNWQEGVDFSKGVYNYIAENKNTQEYQIQSVIPEKSCLRMIHDLFEFLILTYICQEYCKLSYNDETYYMFRLNDYKTNVTTCYGKNCSDWKQHDSNESLKLKIPKICHGPCKCVESDTDISKCIMFDTSDKICFECNCKVDFHSKYHINFGCSSTKSDNSFTNGINDENYIVMKNLITFYKNQNNQEIIFEKMFHKFLNMEDATHQAIYDNFKKEFAEVQKVNNKTNPITCENLLTCVENLYYYPWNTTIITSIEEILSNDFHLETIVNEENESNEATEVRNDGQTHNTNKEKLEIQLLKQEIVEMKQMLQNANDLNAKLIGDMQALTQGCAQNEKETKKGKM